MIVADLHYTPSDIAYFLWQHRAKIAKLVSPFSFEYDLINHLLSFESSYLDDVYLKDRNFFFDSVWNILDGLYSKSREDLSDVSEDMVLYDKNKLKVPNEFKLIRLKLLFLNSGSTVRYKGMMAFLKCFDRKRRTPEFADYVKQMMMYYHLCFETGSLCEDVNVDVCSLEMCNPVTIRIF